MATGDPQGRRARRIERAKQKLGEALAALPDERLDAGRDRRLPRPPRSALLAGPADRGASAPCADRRAGPTPSARRWRSTSGPTSSARAPRCCSTPPTIPGLFMKVAGALALSGVSIVDAHIFTTVDGMALDTLGFQDADDPARRHRPGPAGPHPRQHREGAARRDLAREGAGRPAQPAQARRRVRGRAARADRQHRQPHPQRDRGQRPRPAGPAVRARQDAEGSGPGHPQRPHQHLRRARGRRVLRQGRVRPEDRPPQQDAAGAEAAGRGADRPDERRPRRPDGGRASPRSRASPASRATC